MLKSADTVKPLETTHGEPPVCSFTFLVNAPKLSQWITAGLWTLVAPRVHKYTKLRHERSGN